MFNISYDTWQQICKMYFGIQEKSMEAFLQWFPFSKLTRQDKNRIISKSFYDTYIKTGAFVLFDNLLHCSENYIQKCDGSFRDASLISPILYMVLQAVGKEIHLQYIPERDADIEVYYSGNFEMNRAKYQKEYDDFYKSVNDKKDKYQYFIKTDITSFFNNINVNLLIKRIDEICNNDKVRISQTHLHLYKELLSYCGKGHFPLVENSLASSYLATVIYLDKADVRLKNYIETHIKAFTQFKMIRYVDDMYILISSDEDFDEIHKASNLIRNEYSSILKEYGLALNSTKYCFKPQSEIGRELKKSLYTDGVGEDRSKDIGLLFHGKLGDFLSEIADTLKQEHIGFEEYNHLIEKHFSRSDIMITSGEVFNYFIYEDDSEMKSSKVIQSIITIINQDITFISIDPKRLTTLVTKTQNGTVIRAMLNQLFMKHKNNKWNSYDTSIAIAYLIHRSSKHTDLIDIFRHRCSALYDYYQFFCQRSFMQEFQDAYVNKCVEIVKSDWKTLWLYFMYIAEKRRNNTLVQYAFFKNFFDRFTADIAFFQGKDSRIKKPNYRRYYTKGVLCAFYSENSKEANKIIERAQKLRNYNPLIHSSAELIDDKNTSEEIKNNINDLLFLVREYVSGILIKKTLIILHSLRRV